MSDAVVTVLATTRAVRRHLDLDGVVSRSALDGCIALALQAPSPSNTQGLELVIVDEPCTRAAPAELYRRAFDSYAASPVRDYPEHDARAGREPAVRASAHYLSDRLHEVPVLIVPVGAGRLSASAPASVQASWWGSVLPGVWSFMSGALSRPRDGLHHASPALRIGSGRHSRRAVRRGNPGRFGPRRSHGRCTAPSRGSAAHRGGRALELLVRWP